MKEADSVMSDASIMRNELLERLIAARCKNTCPSWDERKLAMPLIQVSTYIIDAIFSEELSPWKNETYEKKMAMLGETYTKNPDKFLKRIRTAFEKSGNTYTRIIASYLEDSLEEKPLYASPLPEERKIVERALAEHIASYIPIDPAKITFEEISFSTEIGEKNQKTTYLIPKF